MELLRVLVPMVYGLMGIGLAVVGIIAVKRGLQGGYSKKSDMAVAGGGIFGLFGFILIAIVIVALLFGHPVV
ncbi:MAG: hypothetical protein Q8Q91_03210 [Candidatus Daviesbacteria bacterium]|nr:hypothetical protein [Candidatus Daviesbacteria bacterium]